jgi:hypothetical protein
LTALGMNRATVVLVASWLAEMEYASSESL